MSRPEAARAWPRSDQSNSVPFVSLSLSALQKAVAVAHCANSRSPQSCFLCLLTLSLSERGPVRFDQLWLGRPQHSPQAKTSRNAQIELALPRSRYRDWRNLHHVVGADASVQNFQIHSLCRPAHNPRLSFTATAISCSDSRYRSVVCSDECPSKNLICSKSPPFFLQSLAQVRRRSWAPKCSRLPRTTT
jgi:hypothetical protein